MTPAEMALWNRVNRRSANLTPDVARAILRAFQTLRDGLSDSELTRLVSSGQVERIFDSMLSQARFDAAMQPVRDRMRKGIVEGVKYFQRDIVKPKSVTIAFDSLNPDAITGIRQIETRVITTMEDGVRESVRAFVENGLRDGRAASSVAKEIRSVVGLAPNQERAVASFRTLLEGGNREALQRALRDKRFDTTLDRVLGKNGEGLSADQVEKMVDAYRRRSIAMNANTIARTASGDAVKLGQHYSIQSAVERGIYDGDRLQKTWVGVMDSRERPEHVAMEGETVPWDGQFSNGETIPGQSTYSCRCVPRYTQSRTA